jgi:hypothetical protein
MTASPNLLSLGAAADVPLWVESSPNNWLRMPSSRPHPAHQSHDPYAWSRALGLGGAGGRMLMWSIAYIRGCTRERTCDMASPPLNQGRLSRQHLLCSKGPRAPIQGDCGLTLCESTVHESREKGQPEF